MATASKLRVIISWAGKQAETLGKGFREFLPDVLNGIDPFMSASDIDKGSRWSDVLAQNLHESPCAIVCLTPESAGHIWVAFEAGAISKAAGGPDDAKARIWTYLLGLETKELQLTPFSSYQATQPTKDDTFRLIESINRLSPDPVQGDSLKRRFEGLFWPKFNDVILKAVAEVNTASPVVASEPDLLSEVLLTVRTIQEDLKRQNRTLAWGFGTPSYATGRYVSSRTPFRERVNQQKEEWLRAAEGVTEVVIDGESANEDAGQKDDVKPPGESPKQS